MIGCEQTEAPESHRLCPDCVQTCRPYVSQYLSQASSLAFLYLASLPFFLSFLPSYVFRFRYYRDSSSRHSKFFLHTSVSSGDPARFLSCQFLFFHALHCYVSLAIPRFFLFVIELIARPFLFLFCAPALYSFATLDFLSFARFRVWFCTILCLIPVLLLSSIFFPSFDIHSRIFHDTLSSRYSLSLSFSLSILYLFNSFFLFLSLICLFSHLSNPLFRAHSLRLSLFFTHHSRPPWALFLHFVLSFFFLSPQPPPSLIPLAASPSSIYFDRS